MTSTTTVDKMRKLREVAERDCGNETVIANGLLEKLAKQYDVRGFFYTPFGKTRKEAGDFGSTVESFESSRGRSSGNGNGFDFADMLRRQREADARERARQQQQDAPKQSYRVSFTSTMRSTVMALINKMNLSYTTERGGIYVYATAADYAKFDVALDRVKRQWKREMSKVESSMYEFVRSL